MAQDINLDAAIDKFEKALMLDPSLEIEPEQEANRLAAPSLVNRGRSAAERSNFQDASEAIVSASAIANELNLPGVQRSICRLQSFPKLAEVVADATNRRIRYIIRTVASMVFIPI